MVVWCVHENDRKLLQILDALQQGAQGSQAITVLVLPAADPDGVCSTAILDETLRHANVKFLVVPVTSNSDIVRQLVELKKNLSEIRSVVLLNCGASMDLQNTLVECEAGEHVQCYVIDAHRPIMLANMKEINQRVVVVDYYPQDAKERPPIDDSEEEDRDNSEGSGDSEGDKESRKDPEASGGVLRPFDRLASKRQRRPPHEVRLARKSRRISEYYMSAYYATPVAISLFKLARQANQISQDLLWIAAVSLTTYYDQQLVHKIYYDRIVWDELKSKLDDIVDFASASDESGNIPDSPDLPDAELMAP
jgi:cell division control protein 45